MKQKPQMRRTRSSSGTLENKERKQADQRQRDRKAAQPQKEYHTTRKRYKQTINTDLARPHSRKINSQNRKVHQRENISLYIVTDKPRRQHPAYNKEGKQKEERKKLWRKTDELKGKKVKTKTKKAINKIIKCSFWKSTRFRMDRKMQWHSQGFLDRKV